MLHPTVAMAARPGKPATMLRVAYQGEPGAYTEQAAMQFFGAADYIPCNSFRDTFTALASGATDRAAVPIENSLAGTIHENLDLLLKFQGLHIVGEQDFRVKHCLVAKHGVTLADIRVVRSHYMALAQCTGYLAKHGLISEVAPDTAGSAKRINGEGLFDSAAIASRHAAELYDLNVLAEGIEDEKENYTRFLILSAAKDEYMPEKPSKTSITFSLMNKPGALFRALSVFAVLDIDLTKIESRHIHTLIEAVELDPVQARRWGYVFFIDFSRNIAEKPVEYALKNLQEITTFFRLLGSYPMHMQELHD